MSRDPALYLTDSLEACRRIERITASHNVVQLVDDEIAPIPYGNSLTNRG